MGAKNCANHEGQPAVSTCHQCRKDLCKSCVMVTPAGTFCSSECSVLHREMKSQGGGGKKSAGVALKLVLVLLLLVAAVFLIHLAPQTKGSRFDLIGRILNPDRE
jgi:hypothetical protein